MSKANPSAIESARKNSAQAMMHNATVIVVADIAILVDTIMMSDINCVGIMPALESHRALEYMQSVGINQRNNPRDLGDQKEPK
jgi:hypothetical protein